jgi:catechol 2,3-dioxygenase-like lactoylglutathione lyase family enzyme
MIPGLTGIDHVHIYVRSWTEAEAWYQRMLGFRRVEKFMVWAVENGPLTLEDPSGTVHLALFEDENPPGDTAIAFGASGESFIDWKNHLEAEGVALRVADHKLAWSLYFRDPDNNMHEITTYDHAHVSAQNMQVQPWGE